MSFLKKLFGGQQKVDFSELLANGGVLVDVRTPKEFSQAHADGAKNVPLDKIEEKIKKFEQLKKPIILCCRSGIRSGKATAILRKNGVKDVYNGGPWNRFV